MTTKRQGFIRGITNQSILNRCISGLTLLILFAAPLFSTAADTSTSKCLYVSSYHKGYSWSDGVESGLRDVLKDKCILRQYDMNTKRNKSLEDKTRAALEAQQIIQSWKPDIVITSDDNAAKHLVVPFHKNSGTPFVFCGVNWTVEEYGFPFNNVTGIVEVAPIDPMLKRAMTISGGKQAVYLGAETLTEEKNYARIRQGAEKLGVSLSKRLVSTFAEWNKAFKEAQRGDFLVIGSNSGIDGWNDDKANSFAEKESVIVSVTNHEWMMGVSLLGFTKVASEHGEWAAEAALAILEGAAVSDIPIVTNQKWDLWINDIIAESTATPLPSNLARKAKKVAMSE